MLKMRLLCINLILDIVILDQISKYFAVKHLSFYESISLFPGLNLTLAYNTGAAFSLLHDAGGWQRYLFIAIALIVCVVLITWMWRSASTNKWLSIGLALIAGGAIGNMIDRVRLGYVIDFIDVYVATWHWPAFNIADSTICIGAAMLIIDILYSRD